MAQAEDWDDDMMPDVDRAREVFYEWLNSDLTELELSPENDRRVALGLGRR